MGYPLFGMIDLLKLFGGLLVGVFSSHAAREAEMLRKTGLSETDQCTR
jgi:hypothetical protein